MEEVRWTHFFRHCASWRRSRMTPIACSWANCEFGIDEEVKASHGDKFFWVAIQKFVRSLLDE